jgi:acyl-CoA reductase-like NAD-dependent aldehyde dehydrogenase
MCLDKATIGNTPIKTPIYGSTQAGSRLVRNKAVSSFPARGSEHAGAICEVCAEVCEECGKECARHKAEHCQKCAEACRRCAEECRKMASAHPRPAGASRGAGLSAH